MKRINRQQLIISLIKDDLINCKLVNTLCDLGLNADTYYLHLGGTIFELLGFPENEYTENVFDTYLEQLKLSSHVEISASHQALDVLAIGIYYELKKNAKRLAEK